MKPLGAARSTEVDQRTVSNGCAGTVDTPECCALPPKVVQPAAYAARGCDAAMASSNAKAIGAVRANGSAVICKCGGKRCDLTQGSRWPSWMASIAAPS